MTDDAPDLVPVVAVYLRGREHPVLIRYDSRALANQAVLFIAETYLKNAPQDRPGSWCIGRAGESVVVGGMGVSVQQTFDAMAAVDPREIQALQSAMMRERPEWETP